MKIYKLFIGLFLLFLFFSHLTAQETQPVPVWELNQIVDIEHFGFRFNVPTDWHVGEFQAEMGTHLIITENEDDSGSEISLFSILAGMTDVQEFMWRGGMNISGGANTIVNARPAQTIIGEQDSKQAIVTGWNQQGNLLLLQLNSDTINQDIIYTWNLILESVRPIISDNYTLSDVPHTIAEFSINLPDNWQEATSSLPYSVILFATPADTDSDTSSNNATFEIFEIPVSELPEGVLTQEGLQVYRLAEIILNVQFDTQTLERLEEIGLFDKVSFAFAATDVTGVAGEYAVVVNIDEQIVYIWSLRAMTDALDEHKALFFTILDAAKVIDQPAMPVDILFPTPTPQPTRSAPEPITTEEAPPPATTEEL